jgi:hypothetical protein
LSVIGRDPTRRPPVCAPRPARLRAKWKLLCGTHNLLKLWRHTLTQPAARPAAA